MAALPQGEDWKRGDEQDIYEIRECYCPNCGGGNAVTIMLPTKVPLFREIIVMSLACEVSFVAFMLLYSYMPKRITNSYYLSCYIGL
jgi:C4-type Zn-finger protein